MSFLKSIFGGAAPKQPDMNPNKGLEKLEEQAELLRKRIAHINQQIAEQTTIAKQNANTNKARALAALKKKKQLDEQLITAEGTLENIENQKNMLENASSNAAILKTMSETAKIVKQQHNNLDINKVEDIVDEIREQKEMSEEVAKILSEGTTKRVDDDELLKELEDMQQQEVDEALLKTDTLPAVPTKDIPHAVPSSSQKKDEEELDELKKWAAAQ
jgi:charged multivesicular body protein 4